MKPLIIPGIIAKSQVELDDMLAKMNGLVRRVMLDVMDGEFVSNTSLNFDFALPDGFEYEAHLMTQKPLDWLEKNHDKVDVAVLHVETLKDTGKAIKFVREKGLKVTLALSPETELDAVLPYLSDVDAILILTVKPGRYGASFEPGTLIKVKELRKIDSNIPIEVDGAMNPENIRLAKDAGATLFASGSYVMKSDNPGKAIKTLEEAAS
jgi:ribulose-phosphate 3-epimerase